MLHIRSPYKICPDSFNQDADHSGTCHDENSMAKHMSMLKSSFSQEDDLN